MVPRYSYFPMSRFKMWFSPAVSAYKAQLPVGIDLKIHIFKNGVGAGWVGKGKMFRFYH